jgi:hypothetical protein
MRSAACAWLEHACSWFGRGDAPLLVADLLPEGDERDAVSSVQERRVEELG